MTTPLDDRRDVPRAALLLLTRRLITAVLFASVAQGCATSAAPSHVGVPIVGVWGGAHASLTLTEVGGTIACDCAHGGLAAPVVPDGEGAFDVGGVHVREHGGPIRIGEIPDSLPARYVGRVRGDRMTLRALVGKDTIGPFELQLDVPSQLLRAQGSTIEVLHTLVPLVVMMAGAGDEEPYKD